MRRIVAFSRDLVERGAAAGRAQHHRAVAGRDDVVEHGPPRHPGPCDDAARRVGGHDRAVEADREQAA